MELRLHDPIKKSLAETILKAISKKFSVENNSISLKDIYLGLTVPPQKKLGDYAFACFPLAKTFKMGPPQIAALLSNELEQPEQRNAYAKQFKNFGPYLNVFLNHTKIIKLLGEQVLDGSYFETLLTDKTEKTMIEYSQPNTHKELHVGHMRNLCLGDSLIRLHRYCQYDIVSSTFPGDLGTHVAKCLWYLKYKNKDPIPSERRGAWLGSIYSKANNLLEDEIGTEREEENRLALTKILKEIDLKKGEFYDLWRETRKWSIDLMQDVYKWAKVKFDYWYFESDVDRDSVRLINDYYKKGLFHKSEGAIGIELEEEKLGFCLMIKSDGHGLYATKDVELARRKFQDYHIKKSIYIVDSRQSHHFKQVFAVLERMGFENAKDCYHLKYEFVELPDGAMSSRKGNIIPLQTLIEQMEKTICDKYLNRYQDQWDELEIHETAKKIAAGAIKFGMVRIDPGKKIVFNMEDWLKIDGESGPYLQYVYARVQSLLYKFNDDLSKALALKDRSDYWPLLNHACEAQLIFQLTQFNTVILNACTQYRPSVLCSYLYDLGKLFNQFYLECPIGKADTQELKLARLLLAHCTGIMIKKGLELLGIETPKRM